MPEEIGKAEEGNLIDAIQLARKLRRGLRDAGLEPPESDRPTRPSG